MDNYPHDAWVRLGKALERRRGQLGYGFRRRGEFADGTGLSSKTLARIEHAWRDAYPDDTIALIEVIYRWQPGSAEAVLRGGEPVPAEAAATERPPPPADAPELVRRLWWSEIDVNGEPMLAAQIIWNSPAHYSGDEEAKLRLIQAIATGQPVESEDDEAVPRLRRA